MGIPQEGSPVVVGVDGSLHSQEALRWALRQAELEGATVEAVIAWEFPPMTGWGVSLPATELEKAAREALADTVAREAGPDPRVPIRQLTEFGHPADVLLDAARGARLLVVGSRGRGGFTRALLGSVGRNCVEHATCPVVVVRGADT